MNFHQECEEFLRNLLEEIEAKDCSSELEADYNDGILQIEILASKEVFVVNRNSGNQKIWYSSPISGADYFSFDEKTSLWLNQKGQELRQKLYFELFNEPQ